MLHSELRPIIPLQCSAQLRLAGALLSCRILITCFFSPPWSLQSQRHVSDLYEDLRDGHNLISLLEVLSGESLVSIALVASNMVKTL